MCFMKITGLKVQWYHDCTNAAKLIVFAENYDRDELSYNVKADNYYFGVDQESGLCNFYYQDPKNHEGYYGSSFKIKMVDGTQVTLVGPWSSRSGVMNRVGFPLSTEITCESKYNIACSILNDEAEKLIKKYLPELEYYIAEDGRIFIPKHQKLNVEGYKWDEKLPPKFDPIKGVVNY